MKCCKIVALGDAAVGKTSLFMACSRNTYCITKEEFIPSIQDHSLNYIIDNESYLVNLWDTAGGQEHDKLRSLGYPETDVFLICFDVSNRTSFENVEKRWLPEVRCHARDIPVLLVANKIDLRDNNRQKIR